VDAAVGGGDEPPRIGTDDPRGHVGPLGVVRIVGIGDQGDARLIHGLGQPTQIQFIRIEARFDIDDGQHPFGLDGRDPLPPVLLERREVERDGLGGVDVCIVARRQRPEFRAGR